MSDQDNKEKKLVKANAAFYRALAQGDYAGLDKLWAPDEVTCIHPGWPILVGRWAVMGSWREIFEKSGPIALVCRVIAELVHNDEGRVLCLELGTNLVLAATNQFRLLDGEWRMLHHQASAVVDPETYDPEWGPVSQRMH